MSVKWTNFGKTTITTSGGISAAATAVDVASVDDFPTLGASDYFYAVLRRASDGQREIVKITNVSALVLTIVRAIGGTTALAFEQGDNVELRFTADTLQDIVDEQNDEIAAANATAANALATAQAASAVAAATEARFPLVAGSFGAGSIVTADIGADAVTAAKIADLAVGREHLQDDAVGTDEIEDGTVTYAKLHADAMDLHNWNQINQTSENSVLGPTTKATVLTFWAYMVGSASPITFVLYSDTDAAFHTPRQETQVSLASDSISVSFTAIIEKGRYYKIQRVQGGTERLWQCNIKEFGG